MWTKTDSLTSPARLAGLHHLDVDNYLVAEAAATILHDHVENEVVPPAVIQGLRVVQYSCKTKTTNFLWDPNRKKKPGCTNPSCGFRFLMNPSLVTVSNFSRLSQNNRNTRHGGAGSTDGKHEEHGFISTH